MRHAEIELWDSKKMYNAVHQNIQKRDGKFRNLNIDSTWSWKKKHVKATIFLINERREQVVLGWENEYNNNKEQNKTEFFKLFVTIILLKYIAFVTNNFGNEEFTKVT